MNAMTIDPDKPVMQSVEAFPADKSNPIDDERLIVATLAGDAAALRALMNRYDRLVRYTVFRASKERCVRDPQWVESIASSTWLGLVQSLRRNPDHLQAGSSAQTSPAGPRSFAAYLVRIARNQVINEVRRDSRRSAGGLAGDTSIETRALESHRRGFVDSHSDRPTPDIPRKSDVPWLAADVEDPIDVLCGWEDIEALRVCVAKLDEDDRTLMTQLEAITDRRWTDAASALGMRESTLRSRWKGTIDRLRRCLERQSSKNIAPEGIADDSWGGDAAPWRESPA